MKRVQVQCPRCGTIGRENDVHTCSPNIHSPDVGTKVDYVVLLDRIGDFWSPDGPEGMGIRSMRAYLTELREAVTKPEIYRAIEALTYQDQGEEG